MKVVIIIGFYYDNSDNERNIMPGVIPDLFKIYKHSESISPDKIVVITDLNYNDRDFLIYKNNYLDKKKVDMDIVGFMEKIEKNNCYNYYSSKEKFIETIKKSIDNCTELFIYYSGHFKDERFILPYDKFDEQKKITYVRDFNTDPKNKHLSKLSSDEFRDIILSNTEKNSEIFIILDCCNGTNMKLQHFYLDKKFKSLRSIDNKLNINKQSYDNFPNGKTNHNSSRRIEYEERKIILISSSNKNNQSLSENDGSNFTKKISPLLNKKIRSISTFFETLKNDNSMIYSNDKNINLIWRWVFYKESIHVYKDETMKVLIIQ